MVHLFVVYGYQGAKVDADQLQLTDKLFQAVHAEAQVVCTGQPWLIAGALNADPAVIPCLAEGISAGKVVDLALAYSLGTGVQPYATCKFNRVALVRVGDFFVSCPNALAASDACFVTDKWSTPHFSVVTFALMRGWLILLVRRCASRSGLLVGSTLRIGPPRRLLVLFGMSGMSMERSLGWFQRMLYLSLGMRSRSSVDHQLHRKPTRGRGVLPPQHEQEAGRRVAEHQASEKSASSRTCRSSS